MKLIAPTTGWDDDDNKPVIPPGRIHDIPAPRTPTTPPKPTDQHYDSDPDADELYRRATGRPLPTRTNLTTAA